MPDKSRVPVRISDFDDYIKRTNKYLRETTPPVGGVLNYVRLGLTLQNADDWSAKEDDWSNTLHKSYGSPLTSTSVVKEKVKKFMKDFKTFSRPLLNLMAVSAVAGPADANTFNFSYQRKKPVRHTTPIDDRCAASMKGIGGAWVKIICRTDHDSNRASKPPLANCLQMAYRIGTKPEHAGDGTTIVFSSKARFIHKDSEENSGKRIYAYFRWYNFKHPELAGPWGTMYSAMIV